MTDHDDDLIPVEIRVKPLADELEEVRERIKALREREAELTAQIRDTVPGDGTYGPVQVTTPRTLDSDALAADYPAQGFPYLYTLKVDPVKAKAHLDDAQLDAYRVDGTPRVGVRR